MTRSFVIVAVTALLTSPAFCWPGSSKDQNESKASATALTEEPAESGADVATRPYETPPGSPVYSALQADPGVRTEATRAFSSTDPDPAGSQPMETAPIVVSETEATPVASPSAKKRKFF